MSYKPKNAKEAAKLKEKAQNSLLRHGLGQQTADIVIARFDALDKKVSKLQKANTELKGEFATMAGQFRQAYADKMTDDMKQDQQDA